MHKPHRKHTGSLMPRRTRLEISPYNLTTVGFVLGCSLLGCSGQKPPDEVAQKPQVAMTPPSGRSNGGAIATEPEDGQWIRPAKSYSSTRFSGLTEITA